MKDITLILVLILCVFTFISCQVVNRVFLVGHEEYMTNFIKEVMLEVEDRGWHNMVLPDVVTDVHENVLDKEYIGTLAYKNGFLVGIQHMEVLQSSLNQVWQFVNSQTQVTVSGQLRLLDVSVGYDLVAELTNSTHHYTVLLTLPLVTFDFSIIYLPTTHERTVEVVGTQNTLNMEVDILPVDGATNTLTSMHAVSTTLGGIESWAEVLRGVAQEIADSNKVPFPQLCYNCAL